MKMILKENTDGNLFWLPENYEELNIEISAGVPENLYGITPERIEAAVENFTRRMRSLALAKNMTPSVNTAKEILIAEMTKVLKIGDK